MGQPGRWPGAQDQNSHFKQNEIKINQLVKYIIFVVEQ